MEKGKSVKTKVALFLGYNGCSFLGLQYQRDTANTVENVLHKTICDQGFVLKSNMDNLRRIKWSRAGRTDKKVHALCNGISLNLELDDRYIIDRATRQFDLNKVAADINADLPTDVRILAAKKVGKGFDMRHDTCSRIYNYIAPISLFYTKEQFTNKQALNELEQDELLNKIHDLAQLYLGTHSFHNFTKGYKTTDPRCDRFIIGMKVQLLEQEVVKKSLNAQYETEEQRKANRVNFVRFTLVGQSFIYHQIRKMVGLLIKICYEGLDGPETIKQAFGKEKYDVYLAPGEGLYLNRMTFDLYNKKKESNLKVELDQEDEKRILEYRKYLEGVILQHELKEHLFTNWLLKHDEKPESEDEQPDSEEREKHAK